MVKIAEIPDLLLRVGINVPVGMLNDGNQIAIPQSIADSYADTSFFEITQEDGRLVLTPHQRQPPHVLSEKMAALGLTEADAADAVAWARRGDGDSS